MSTPIAANNSIMTALEQFEATEANLIKVERLWDEMVAMIPTGVAFGENVEYEDRARSFDLLLASLPKIGGWKPTATPPDIDGLAQSRLDAMEIDEPSAHVSVERWIEEPGRELREYRFRFNNTRKALIRDALVGLIDQIDADIRAVRAGVGADADPREQINRDVWSAIREHMKQIEVLLGSSVKKPARWSDMMRHMHFGYVGDLHDIEAMDWPDVKNTLRKGLYGVNEAVPVEVEDLSALVAARPTGPITTALAWSKIDDQAFERLIFTLISDTPGYENPEWLMQTRAPDKGRDLSVMRVIQDELSGTLRLRVVIQCKHWTSRSVSLSEVSSTKDQMALWPNPRVDVLIIATSGRFTADAVTWIEQHNANGASPRIEMWPESHLERLLAARPAIIAEFGLRGH
ncbi:restriction endonuclease [Bradyrhizobium elkanii]|uniref:restriction endonuclease n=1 Tax=Bradyrhizobium elkanii TaxID=29448 RepID=UPI001BAE276A|nr:restriction endonuclease [Bradyrhizobium elkanii]MBR1158072.1 restriction endonuclease [Bradyrhizobium elkanii]